MIVCVCHNISESELRAAIHAGHDTLHALRDNLAVGTSCGKCKSCAKKILRDCHSTSSHPHADVHTLHFQPAPV